MNLTGPQLLLAWIFSMKRDEKEVQGALLNKGNFLTRIGEANNRVPASFTTMSRRGSKAKLVYAPSPSESLLYLLLNSDMTNIFLVEMDNKISTDATSMNAKRLNRLSPFS